MLLLTITGVVVVVMAVLMQFGFKQGFNQYKKSLEKELNDRMVVALQTHYEVNQSWQLFADEPRAWHELIFESATERRVEHLQQKQAARQAQHKTGDHEQSPPRNRSERRPRSNNSEAENQHIKRSELSRVLPLYSLFDQGYELVIGRVMWDDKNAVKIKLKDQGQVVGYLVYDKQPGPGRKQDKQFNETFVMLLTMIAGVMILVALLFTFPVAKYFTRPIRALNNATKKAAGGDFNVRINIDRNDELGQLGQNFNLLTSTLASNAEIQKRMMADISHELRTPVAVLLAQIEAIQDGIHEADDNSLRLLHSQTKALHHLINDLHQLSVTDLGSMQYQMQSVDLVEIISQVKGSLDLSAQEKNIQIQWQSTGDSLLVLGDKNRLLQLFTNLLNNAINYTDVGGQILIKGQGDSRTDHYIITIDDSAPGLLPHEMEQMFDRLYRADGSRNKQFGGSGLGLAIAKNIVEAHHGQIQAKASNLGGVCLIVRIPKHV